MISWFRGNERDRLWRRTCDPYTVLVSEVMLQIQVKRSVPFYLASWSGSRGFVCSRTHRSLMPSESVSTWDGTSGWSAFTGRPGSWWRSTVVRSLRLRWCSLGYPVSAPTPRARWPVSPSRDVAHVVDVVEHDDRLARLRGPPHLPCVGVDGFDLVALGRLSLTQSAVEMLILRPPCRQFVQEVLGGSYAPRLWLSGT